MRAKAVSGPATARQAVNRGALTVLIGGTDLDAMEVHCCSAGVSRHRGGVATTRRSVFGEALLVTT